VPKLWQPAASSSCGQRDNRLDRSAHESTRAPVATAANCVSAPLLTAVRLTQESNDREPTRANASVQNHLARRPKTSGRQKNRSQTGDEGGRWAAGHLHFAREIRRSQRIKVATGSGRWSRIFFVLPAIEYENNFVGMERVLAWSGWPSLSGRRSQQENGYATRIPHKTTGFNQSGHLN